jgi:CheY-like chemotaxis protein
MSGDLVTVRILAAFGSPSEREPLRRAAALAPMPVELIEVEADRATGALVADRELDVVLIDAAAPDAAVAAARLGRRAPLVVRVAAASARGLDGAGADGVVVRPAAVEQAQAVIRGCIRLRLGSRVLIVDDSATMRSIVRKLLAGARFPLQIEEAEEGIAALKEIATGRFDVVLLDYNMPGLNGLETLSEIRRQYPRVQVVIMTSQQDQALARRARAAGAAAFLRKPFYPADVEAVFYGIYGLRPAS